MASLEEALAYRGPEVMSCQVRSRGNGVSSEVKRRCRIERGPEAMACHVEQGPEAMACRVEQGRGVMAYIEVQSR